MTVRLTRRAAMELLGGAAVGAAAIGSGLSKAIAAEPTLLRVSLLPIYSVAPHFAADKLGYFAAENIAVTTTAIQSGVVGIPGLISGGFEVLYTNTVSVLTAIERGIDIRIIAECTRVPKQPPEGLAFFARKGENIKTGKDLEGRPVAINAKFALQWLTLSKWIKMTGGDVDKVNYREIPNASMVDALKSKQVDAAFLIDPYKQNATDDPTLELVSHPSTSTIPGLATGVWVVSGKMADEKPDLVRGYRRAYLKGGEWVNSNFGKPAYYELVSSFTKMEPERVVKMAAVPQEMVLSPAAINGIGDVMLEFGLLKSKVDVTPKVFK
jgi:NitT/TauT family transport system substrate-binding protein